MKKYFYKLLSISMVVIPTSIYVFLIASIIIFINVWVGGIIYILGFPLLIKVINIILDSHIMKSLDDKTF